MTWNWAIYYLKAGSIGEKPAQSTGFPINSLCRAGGKSAIMLDFGPNCAPCCHYLLLLRGIARYNCRLFPPSITFWI
jgi:hypothetical protein